MGDLTIHRTPKLREPYLIASFMGWPDASEVASSAMRYLLATLGGEKFAKIESEGFYNFTRARPIVRTLPNQNREVLWHPNEFYCCSTSGKDLILFLGAEPHLRWKSYGNAMMEVARQWNVSKVVTLGGTYDRIPHTVEPSVTGSSSDPEMRQKLQGSSTYVSSYQGPTSIHSLIINLCQEMNIPSASLWGHAPHYIQITPNSRSAYSLLKKLNDLMQIDVPLDALKSAAAAMEEQINEAISSDPRLQEYVRQLEERYKELHQPQAENLDPQELIKDLEDFLRKRGTAGQ